MHKHAARQCQTKHKETHAAVYIGEFKFLFFSTEFSSLFILSSNTVQSSII